MYVYILSEDYREDGVRHQLWTVGFYKPDGSFNSESDHATTESAAARVAYLNGGIPTDASEAITEAAKLYYEVGG